jgi:sugar phosphate isomerase/epimerase
MALGLSDRVPALAEAVQQTGVKVAAVHMGRQDGYIAPDLDEREAAINTLRQAFADAADLGAAHVVFVPQYGPTRMPDLRPYQSPIELESQMMIRLLRTVSDLAYAMGVELDYLPVRRDQSSFLNRLDHAARFREKIKSSPYVKVAANLCHCAIEEADWQAALRDNLPHIGYIQIGEQDGALPGQGMLDFAALAAILADYPGWLTLCAEADKAWSEVPASMAYLRRVGFSL